MDELKGDPGSLPPDVSWIGFETYAPRWRAVVNVIALSVLAAVAFVLLLAGGIWLVDIAIGVGGCNG